MFISVISPEVLGDATVIALRFPFMAILLLFAAVLPEPFERPAGRMLATAAVFCLAFARLAHIDHIWQARQSDVRSLESALSHVPPGATVFALQSEPTDARKEPVGRYLACCGAPTATVAAHRAALAIPQRHAFVPFLFAVPGQQPVRLLPPWDALAPDSYTPPDVHAIDVPPSPDLLRTDPYLQDWDKRFDYVVLIGMDHEDRRGPFHPPAPLQLVSDDGYARLYRIAK